MNTLKPSQIGTSYAGSIFSSLETEAFLAYLVTYLAKKGDNWYQEVKWSELERHIETAEGIVCQSYELVAEMKLESLKFGITIVEENGYLLSSERGGEITFEIMEDLIRDFYQNYVQEES